MRKIFIISFIGIGFTIMISCEKKDTLNSDEFTVIKYDPLDVSKDNPMHVYVHYMPWFEDKTSSTNGNWGIHWTMLTRNPEVVDEDGKREIASHFYPLIGPYASSDPDVIEYHLLLMKYAGIEGILIDWYGASDINDYVSIRTNAEKLTEKITETGLKFAIVYEDRTISAAVDQDPLTDRIEAARNDMIYIEDQYFSKEDYIRIDGLPLFLVFGPEEFHAPDEWSEIISAYLEEPLFLILNGKSHETSPSSSGEYIWVDNSSLDVKYGTMGNFEYFMGGSYPGFLDYYAEGGWGEGFDWQIEYNNGETFTETLQKSQDYGVDYLQLITWNDFGEGTMIEPTDEFGYNMLSRLQDFACVTYTEYELEKIFNLYKLRKNLADDNQQQQLLNQSFYYFVSLQTEKAIAIVDSLDAKE
ncbi:hypothetical protein ES708_19411 [subsurface metagenome]